MVLVPGKDWLSVALHLGMGLCETSSIHTGMSTGILTVGVMLRRPYYWNFTGAALCHPWEMPSHSGHPGPLASLFSLQ